MKDDFELLKAELLELEDENLRLFDLERGEGRYAGLVRSGENRHQVHAGLSWQDLGRKRQELDDEYLCLIDVETWHGEDRRTYAGVWAPCGDPGSLFLVRDLSKKGFKAKRKQLAGTHHLVDFETCSKNGELEILGLWHPAPVVSESRFGIFRPWDKFISKAIKLNKSGFRLAEVESLATGEGVRFSGRWERNTANDWLLVGFQEADLRKADKNLSAGFGKSGVTAPFPEGFIGLAGEKLRLVSLAIYALEVPSLGPGVLPVARAPVHDAGTAEPPP